MLGSMNNSLIKDLNKDEKPREKLAAFGANNLSDTELIALLIHSGVRNVSALDISRAILKETKSVRDLLKHTVDSLRKFKGINTAKACTILAALELGMRLTTPSKTSKVKIEKPEDVYKFLKKDFYCKNKELLLLISVNTRNNIIAKDIVSIGSLNETIVSPRDIFSTAFSRNAACIVLAHNHPSNDPTPSMEDIKVTEKVALLGKDLNIPLLDHVIIANDNYCSLKKLNLFNVYTKGGENNE